MVIWRIEKPLRVAVEQRRSKQNWKSNQTSLIDLHLRKTRINFSRVQTSNSWFSLAEEWISVGKEWVGSRRATQRKHVQLPCRGIKGAMNPNKSETNTDWRTWSRHWVNESWLSLQRNFGPLGSTGIHKSLEITFHLFSVTFWQKNPDLSGQKTLSGPFWSTSNNPEFVSCWSEPLMQLRTQTTGPRPTSRQTGSVRFRCENRPDSSWKHANYKTKFA